ncbi:MAG: hypothetical protein JWQ56_776 [Pseudarthrobacter sp.]|nr:hypothetical protein [Pseudarthrobacter sp.]
MNLNGPFVGFADVGVLAVVLAPHYAHQIGPGTHRARSPQQLVQQVEFAPGQSQRRATEGHCPSFGIECKPVVLQHTAPARTGGTGGSGGANRHGLCRGRSITTRRNPGPAQHRRYPGTQFPWPEGLDNVVVRSALECRDGVKLLIPAGQHYNVGVTELPDAPKDFKAVNVRETDVESYDVRLTLPGHVNTVTAGPCRMHLKTCLLQNRVEEIPHVDIILDDHGNTKITHHYLYPGKTTAQPSAMR